MSNLCLFCSAYIPVWIPDEGGTTVRATCPSCLQTIVRPVRPLETERVLLAEVAKNLRHKASLWRRDSSIADSCNDLARIIEEYLERTASAPSVTPVNEVNTVRSVPQADVVDVSWYADSKVESCKNRIVTPVNDVPSVPETKTRVMKLYEILTPNSGDSYERAYAWAHNEDQARYLFYRAHPSVELCQCNELFSSEAKPFVTALDCDGFEMSAATAIPSDNSVNQVKKGGAK